MADRLAGTLRMLEADRDRLREFVADVSHELRTPIAALRMYTELQADGDVDEATKREFLERSIEQIGRLEWLSTNLLDLSRIDAGIFPLDIRHGDVRDPIQAVVQALSEAAVRRGVALDSTVPSEPVEMSFDRERIVQLMTNLIGNALKFTPRGGAVSVHLEPRSDEVVVRISDTGPGIPADELPRIFDRFYRGTNTGEARASGSGLGLAIVRSIVDMHGGAIDVASQVGEGTEVRITLPRTRAPSADEADVKVNETSRGTHPARNPGARSVIDARPARHHAAKAPGRMTRDPNHQHSDDPTEPVEVQHYGPSPARDPYRAARFGHPGLVQPAARRCPAAARSTRARGAAGGGDRGRRGRRSPAASPPWPSPTSCRPRRSPSVPVRAFPTPTR